MHVQISHFYHIYADGQWYEPVSEHINAIQKYGLSENLTNFFVGFVGSKENISNVKDFLSNKIKYSIVDEQPEGWEQVTMEHLRNYIQENDGYTFYAHTKGAHDPSQINIEWRKSMTFYNIVNWRFALAKLKFADTVGCHWCNNAFWGGTYWWAKNEYLRQLPPLKYDNRWRAEEWIGSYPMITIYDLNPGWPGFHLFTTEWQ